jgi:ribosomal protein L28
MRAVQSKNLEKDGIYFSFPHKADPGGALFADAGTDTDDTEDAEPVGPPTPEASDDDFAPPWDEEQFWAVIPEPPALDPAHATRRQLGFEHYRLTHRDARTRQIFTRNLQNQFFIWNDHLGEVEPNFSYAQKVVGKYAPADHKRRAKFVDRDIIAAHPSLRRDERILQKENELLPFGKVHGKHANIGQFINLKLVPKMIYIHIKRGVPEYALDLLVKRIIEHADDAPTRILRKQSKKGKWSYRTWISTPAMNTLGQQGLLEKILKITNHMKKSVTIVIRQKMKDYGKVHEIWDSSFSLL